MAGAECALHMRQLRGVAAQQAVLAAAPEITRARDCHGGRRWRVIRTAVEAGIRRRQQPMELHAGEAEDVEVDDRLVPDAGDLGGEQGFVPAGVQRDLVVRQPKRPRLRRGQMAEPQHRYGGEAKLLRRHDAAMAGDQHALGVDQHRVHEAELGDGGGDLRHLRRRMRARVLGIGDQRCDRQSRDDEIRLHWR
jgi:hypothetical protein